MGTQVFSCEYRVTYADCTVGNHIYYARYLEILEFARGEFSRALGFPLRAMQEQDTIFPVIECRLRYKAPARYDDVLVIELWISHLDRIRVMFDYRIVEKQAQKLILEGQTQHVCTTVGEKPKRVPEEIAAALQNFLRS